MSSRALLPFLVWPAGGLILVPLDALHVTSGTIPTRAAGLEVAIPLFVVGATIAGLACRFIAVPVVAKLFPASAGAPPAPPARATLVALAFLVAYGASSFVHERAVLALVAYLAVFVVVTVLTPASARPGLVLMAVGAGVVGPAFESYFSSTGAFAYARPDFARIPMWLPAVYLLGGAAVHTVDRALPRATAPSR